MSPTPTLFVCTLFFGFFLLASPVQSAEAQTSPMSVAQQETVSTINAQDFRALITDKKPLFILDVRQQDEYDAGHIENSVLIPLDTLKDHYKELPKNKIITVYCRSGRRSANAVSFLRSHGYDNAVSLSGGYKEWRDCVGC